MKKKILSIFVVLGCLFALPAFAEEVAPITQEQAIEIAAQKAVEMGWEADSFEMTLIKFDVTEQWWRIHFTMKPSPNGFIMAGGHCIVYISMNGEDIEYYAGA